MQNTHMLHEGAQDVWLLPDKGCKQRTRVRLIALTSTCSAGNVSQGSPRPLCLRLMNLLSLHPSSPTPMSRDLANLRRLSHHRTPAPQANPDLKGEAQRSTGKMTQDFSSGRGLSLTVFVEEMGLVADTDGVRCVR